MINDGWPTLTAGRKMLLALALIGLGYLFLQTKQGPAQISGWNGNPFAAAAMGALPGQAQAIAAEAAPMTGRGPGGQDIPNGNPLGQTKTILTQGYGVGSHAPAAIWGGVDLAIDGNNDNEADPQGTLNAPIYATQAGVARLKPNTWPAGNYLAIEGIQYKTAFAHLNTYAVEDGQTVEPGQIIGYIGSTGQSSGPHLHYEVWKDGANVDPLDYGVLSEVR